MIFLIIFCSVHNNIGAYDDEEAAARAYDLAALKYWGAGTQINFPVSHFYLCGDACDSCFKLL
jgi:hypothetical protein